MPPDKVIAIAVLAAALSTHAAAQDPSPRCLAESLPPLRLLESVPTECKDSPQACVESCASDSPEYCLAAAYALQATDDRARAHTFFERACAFGLANGCTNLGAGIWSADHTDEEISCAGRLFQAACSVGEHFACGMVGRLAFERARSESDYPGVRKELERACSGVGGFSCRVLASYLETGKLGPYGDEAIRELLARACESGDRDACGQPDTAEETFK
jgi:TPR repeat protein